MPRCTIYTTVCGERTCKRGAKKGSCTPTNETDVYTQACTGGIRCIPVCILVCIYSTHVTIFADKQNQSLAGENFNSLLDKKICTNNAHVTEVENKPRKKKSKTNLLTNEHVIHECIQFTR